MVQNSSIPSIASQSSDDGALRVFYPYAVMPEKPRIADALRRELGWEPVLWISPTNLREDIHALFPEAHVQTVEDAFYGRLLPGVNTDTPPVPDAAMWQRLQGQIPAMLGMMNYYGPPDAFLYGERERFARNLLLQWNEIILALKPDIVFFEEAPHAPHTWALYALCLEYGISTPFFMPTAVPTFTVLKDRVDGPVLRLAECQQKVSEDPCEWTIHPDIRRAADKLIEGERFSAWYMDKQAEAEVSARSTSQESNVRPLPSLTQMRKLKKIVNVHKWPRYAHAMLNGLRAENPPSEMDSTSEWILLKKPGRPLGDSYSTGEFSTYREMSAERKAALKADYLSRCVEPDTSRNYVYFALHYQPERTTDSDGGIFRDQFLAVAMLHEALPEGWLLYVKEHPSQFAYALHGDKARTADFYDDLQKLPHVRLISSDYPSKHLTMDSQAVATVTGTLAWEAALNLKPALTFGFTWYEGCPGVYRVRNGQDARAAFSEIQSGQHASRGAIDGFLAALTCAAYRVDLNAWVKDSPEVTVDEQISGMVDAMTWWQEHRFRAVQHD